MTLTQFRAKWGRKWATFVAGEMFKDAAETIESNSAILQVASLAPETVKALGDVLLAKQQGFLIYGNAMRFLHEPPGDNPADNEEPQYPSPLEEESKDDKPAKPKRKKGK